MRLVSLKARILLGAILWTIGLFTIAGILLNFWHENSQLMRHHRLAEPVDVERGFVIRVLHSTFRSSPAAAVVAGLCMYFGFL